jgi:hypothetical protein
MIAWSGKTPERWAWPEEPAVEPIRGWRLVCVWAALFVASWLVLAGIVAGTLFLLGRLRGA